LVNFRQRVRSTRAVGPARPPLRARQTDQRRPAEGGFRIRLSLALVLAFTLCAAPEDENASEKRLRRRVERVARELGALGLPVNLDGVKIERARDVNSEHVFEDLYGTDDAAVRDAWDLFCSRILHVHTTAGRWLPAAYYAPRRSAIVVMDWGHAGFASEDEVVAHELGHIRQHARDDDELPARSPGRRTSEQLCIEACVREGEAEAVSLNYALSRLGLTLNEAALEEADLAFEQGTAESGPHEAAYALGRALVVPVILRDGWNGPARFRENLPVSTEQIIHPEKVGVDVPTEIDWPEIPEAEGSVAWEDTAGEMFIYEWLAFRFGRADAWSAATGWDGDSWRAVRLSSGRRIVVWASLWDREADAVHFAGDVGSFSPCEVLAKGRAVVCVAGEDMAAARKWGQRVLGHLGSVARNPRDAASTTRAEEKWLRSWRPPAVRDGWWHLPLLGVRVPAPSGWQQDLHWGSYVLRYHRPTDPNDSLMYARVLPTGGPATADTILRRLDRLKDRDEVERVISAERVTVDGRQAVLAEHAFGWARVWAPERFLWLYLPTDRGIVMLGAMVTNRHRRYVWADVQRALLETKLDE